MGFVMLNPSTADAEEDDPTIRRCIGFAGNMGYGGIEVVNLFAYRATNPKALADARDPVGPENDEAILEAMKGTGIVVCAWGALHFDGLADRVGEVLALLKRANLVTACLALTQDGEPRHPLYLGYRKAAITPYPPRRSP